MPSTGLESIDGVITKFLQDKDSLHCIALFNVTQLYENLKTNKNKQKQDRTLLTKRHRMKSKHFIVKIKISHVKLVSISVMEGKNKNQLHMESKLLAANKRKQTKRDEEKFPWANMGNEKKCIY